MRTVQHVLVHTVCTVQCTVQYVIRYLRLALHIIFIQYTIKLNKSFFYKNLPPIFLTYHALSIQEKIQTRGLDFNIFLTTFCYILTVSRTEDVLNRLLQLRTNIISCRANACYLHYREKNIFSNQVCRKE